MIIYSTHYVCSKFQSTNGRSEKALCYRVSPLITGEANRVPCAVRKMKILTAQDHFSLSFTTLISWGLAAAINIEDLNIIIHLEKLKYTHTPTDTRANKYESFHSHNYDLLFTNLGYV